MHKGFAIGYTPQMRKKVLVKRAGTHIVFTMTVLQGHFYCIILQIGRLAQNLSFLAIGANTLPPFYPSKNEKERK
jgi:hypothetical protein